MEYKYLALFDIDSTLLKGSKAHWDAFSYAFKKVYSAGASINIINSHGMTDQQIIIEVLRKKGLEEQEIKPRLKECMSEMDSYFKKSIKSEEAAVLPGVKRLLNKLKKSGILLGLVTGNLESIARGKLKNAGLNHYFKIGGFGSDDIDRTKLVKLAIKKAGKYRLNIKTMFLFSEIHHMTLEQPKAQE